MQDLVSVPLVWRTGNGETVQRETGGLGVDNVQPAGRHHTIDPQVMLLARDGR